MPRPARTQHSVISEQSVIGYSVLLLSCPLIILCAWCPLRHPARDWLCLPHAPWGGMWALPRFALRRPKHIIPFAVPPPLDARHHQAYIINGESRAARWLFMGKASRHGDHRRSNTTCSPGSLPPPPPSKSSLMIGATQHRHRQRGQAQGEAGKRPRCLSAVKPPGQSQLPSPSWEG